MTSLPSETKSLDVKTFEQLNQIFSMFCNEKKPLKSKDIIAIGEEFRRIDTDKNGFLSTVEMKLVLAEYQPDISDAEMDGMIQLADTNGDGKLDYEEFATLYSVFITKWAIDVSNRLYESS